MRLLLSAGRGPAECAWAVARLVGRLESEAARRKVPVRRAEEVPGERPGTFRSVLLEITGDGADEFAAGWTGTLCWQAPSPYRPSHGRKNWFVTAAPLDEVPGKTAFAEDDVDVVGVRTGGPGGQQRNKASTAVRATHRPSGTVVVVDTERQFTVNRRIALDLIRQRLASHDEAAGAAAESARRRKHDELIRGNAVRTERR